MMNVPDNEAYRALARWRKGVLLADERPHAVNFIADPQTGRLALPAPRHALDAEQRTLFVPDEDLENLQLVVSPEGPAPERLSDRWRAYHGDAPAGDVRFTVFEIEFGRLGPRVADGADLMAPNPLSPHETGLCRRANADALRLHSACLWAGGCNVTDPLCVGVDPLGLYVRHRLGVLRAPFLAPAASEGDAERAIDELLSGAEAGE